MCDEIKFTELPNAQKLWWWQKQTAKFLVTNPKAFVTSTPRTGKTYAVATALYYLQKQKEITRALIVAPLSTLDHVWQDTFLENFPFHRIKVIHAINKEKRIEQLNQDCHIYIINPDGIKLIANELIDAIKKNDINCIVIDELTNYSNTRSDRWKSLNKCVKLCKYTWGLTGTPGNCEHVYGQIKLIKPFNVPIFYAQWRSKTMYQVSPFKWLPKEFANDIILKSMQPNIRFDKADIMKIPDPKIHTVYVPLSQEQKKAYDTLYETLKLNFEDIIVRVLDTRAMINKLLQVSAGSVIGSWKVEKRYIHLDITPRLNKLKEIIESTPYKTVIFSAFVDVNTRLVKELSKFYTCEKIDGYVRGKKRTRIFTDFQKSVDPQVLICHIDTTAFGVELAAADKIIFFGPSLSGAFKVQQASERISSSEQKASETNIYQMYSSKAEETIFSKVLNNVNANKTLVGLFTEIIHAKRFLK